MALTNLNGSPAWTQQSVITAALGRLHIGALLPSAPATTGLTVWRDGVIATTNQSGSNNIPNDLQIKASGSPSLTLTCEAGHCVITKSGQGPYLCVLPTQGNVTLATADPANPRIDLIVAQIYDSAQGDTMPTTPALAAPGGVVIRAITGTPGGVPVVPTPTAGQIPLAQVLVVANDTTITSGDITDRRKSAYNPSGARPLLPGDASSDAGAVSGEVTYRPSAADGGLYVWSGSRWKSASIPVFSTVAARDAAITSPYVGEMAYTSDYQLTWVWLGSLWASREEQMVGWARRLTTSPTSTSTVEVGIHHIDNIAAVSGMPLRIEYSCHPDSGTIATTARVEVRVKVGGAAAGPGETVCFNSQTFAPVSAGPRTWSFLFIPTSTGAHSFATCIASPAGPGVWAFADSTRGSELKIFRTRTDIVNTGVNFP